MWNKLSSSAWFGRFNNQRLSFLQQHDLHIQYASIAVSLLASVLAVMHTRSCGLSAAKRGSADKNNYFFIAMVAMFIAHGIAFGYQRLVLEPGNRMAGMGALIAAVTAFTRAAMCMQERGQLAGMVIIAGGVLGCLYGMMTMRKDKVILEASRWMMAVCAPMVVLAKAPVLMSGHADLPIAVMQTITTGLRVMAFKRFQERGLYGYVLANFTICLAELLMAVNSVLQASMTNNKLRRSSRRSTMNSVKRKTQ